jgi:hypothetical protein
MTLVPESADWIFKALTRGSADFPPARHEPHSLSPKSGRVHSDLRSIFKQIALPLYRLVRPLVRPLLWRLRSFMIGPLAAQLQAERDLLASFTAKLEGLGAHIHHMSSMQAELRAELNLLREELSHLQDEFYYLWDDLNFERRSMQSQLAKDTQHNIEAK